ncbi:c-type cytochrome biogenesis protein CcmI [Pseudooceanicola sp. CBS1P-1]|uniref:C-type cytochrome biogenesis protein CcmI n=1 Tax=Pseudooceanicola albus TaxID=2692189 RepID=A0A6L7G018_9RHOB|nr:MULTISPECIES: c-type cytochrome biogenesis protein CcmI [Pseudooceanicola]MBT9382296.1 c-type cytochrome biogenesis protein CcmI [Pseudooceanicola endophyticus]MXN16838.1 c-type cytochrome biogenesis protein CcmI [Pseudooceanicola albus]
MIFWLVTLALALAVAAILARAALSRREVPAQPAEAQEIEVYRAQLAEVERDLSRGALPASEAERVRTEISRRLLAADGALRKAGTAQVIRGPGRGWAIGGGIVVILVAVGIYVVVGVPGYPDMPRSSRIAAAKTALAALPTQAEAEKRGGDTIQTPEPDVSADYLALMTKLREAVKEHPDDLRGQRLLARNEAALGHFAAAHQAQAQVIRLEGDKASGQDYAEYADMLILSAGGLISNEASGALQDALKRDPSNGTATYYTGLLMAQTGRPDIAFKLWDGLLRRSPDSAPWVPSIRARLPQLAEMAGENRYQLPPLKTQDDTAPNPSADDIADMQKLSPEERTARIQGMVSGLEERLTSDGGSVGEWVRLITSLGVLGQKERAQKAYDQALQAFAGQDDSLVLLNQAAQTAGVSQTPAQ